MPDVSGKTSFAGNAARDNKNSRILPGHLQLAIRNDEESKKLLGGETKLKEMFFQSSRQCLSLRRQLQRSLPKLLNRNGPFYNNLNLFFSYKTATTIFARVHNL